MLLIYKNGVRRLSSRNFTIYFLNFGEFLLNHHKIIVIFHGNDNIYEKIKISQKFGGEAIPIGGGGGGAIDPLVPMVATALINNKILVFCTGCFVHYK